MAPQILKLYGKTVILYAMPTTPAIHVGDDIFPVRADRSIEVPAAMVDDFLTMGCTREPPKLET